MWYTVPGADFKSQLKVPYQPVLDCYSELLRRLVNSFPLYYELCFFVCFLFVALSPVIGPCLPPSELYSCESRVCSLAAPTSLGPASPMILGPAPKCLGWLAHVGHPVCCSVHGWVPSFQGCLRAIWCMILVCICAGDALCFPEEDLIGH